MDPLSDLLRVVRLDGAYFYTVEAAEPWSAETVAARELSPRIMPTAEHLISYHILTEGRCYGGIVGEQQVERLAWHLPPPGVRRIPTRPGRRCKCPHQTGRSDVHRGAASLPRRPASRTDRLARRTA